MPKKSILFAILVTALFSGCASKKPAQLPDPIGSAEAMGPMPAPSSGDIGPQPLPQPSPTASASAEAQGPVGPVPGPDYVPPKDGIVLVLGPGLARGFAYLGVLHEFESKHVAVNGIVGVEIGAVVAGIWASSNVNNLEWEMHKFKRQTLLDPPLLGLRNNVAEGKKILSFLGEAVKVEYLQKMKVPTLIASMAHDGSTDGIRVDSNGPAKEIIRGAMGIPGIIKPYSIDGTERVSAGLDTPFPAQQAKALGVGKVVCVDVIGRGDNFKPKEPIEQHLAALMKSTSAIARQQLKDCDGVLSINAEGISYLNFDAKADLIYKGRAAVQKWLEQGK